MRANMRKSIRLNYLLKFYLSNNLDDRRLKTRAMLMGMTRETATKYLKEIKAHIQKKSGKTSTCHE